MNAAPERQAALSPVPVETTLVVPGMHCAGCIGKVERGLGAVSGVASARVNLSARQVKVVHDPAIGPLQLIETLAGIGFASQPRGEELEPAPSAVKPLLAPLAVAGFASMNVMLLSVAVWSGAAGSTRALFTWLSALIAVPAVVYSGRVFFVSAWAALSKRTTNMDVPISVGVILATGLSLYETVTGGAHAWFEGTVMLLFFLLAGRVLDAAMRDRARSGVEALLRQAAPGALVIESEGTLEWLAASDLLPGMVMRVAAGERLAADGEIVSGASRLDRSLLTGESVPVACEPGDCVHAGTLNLTAPIDVRIDAAAGDTALAEIARLMEVAGQVRSRYVRIADRAARFYAPAVHLLALLSFLGWMAVGAGWHQSLVVAIAVLIITCPCALGLAVPVAQVVACGSLMRAGIMVKDGAALERLAGVDRALLDKTGTLTLGRPLPDPAVLDALSPEDAAVALALASHSRHPLSRALVEALAARGVRPAVLDEVSDTPGYGIQGQWQGRAAALRRPDGFSPDRFRGAMAVSLDIEGRPVWLIPFADRLRPDCTTALQRLRAMGVALSILSGDNCGAVAEVARATGLTAQAGADPVAKQAAIERLRGAGRKVLMVGDGLNDGPALALADASMAPGSASDLGRQAADIVFLGDSLLALPRALGVARRALGVVKQNFGLAIAYNVLAVPLAMAGRVTPLGAALAMSSSSLIVIANSLRLARRVE